MGNIVTEEIAYLYDESGVIGMVHTYNGASSTYYFSRNLQGDIVAIYNTSGNVVARYNYDAFGKCTIAGGSNITIANANSFRYRGYYLDQETGFYFLNSRYYSPEFRRFISPDDTNYLDPENVNGLNLYCYCNNDPVNYADPSGHMPEWAKWLIGGVTFTGALVLTAVTGGALVPIFIGMGASIL